MNLFILYFCIVRLICCASVNFNPSPECDNLVDLDIDFQNVNNQKQQNIVLNPNIVSQCYSRSNFVHKSTLTQVSYIIRHATINDCVEAVDALANYIKLLKLADQDNQLEFVFSNATRAYRESLPAVFRTSTSEIVKREAKQKFIHLHKGNHSISSWFQRHIDIVKSKFHRLDHSEKASLTANCKYIWSKVKFIEKVLGRRVKAGLRKTVKKFRDKDPLTTKELIGLFAIIIATFIISSPFIPVIVVVGSLRLLIELIVLNLLILREKAMGLRL